MKFYRATLYKVPFDNTYKNVVDYHRYTKNNDNTLTHLTRTKEQIILQRDFYFSNVLANKLLIYNGEGDTTIYKSVKITGKYVECSIAGLYENMKDYNYIVFEGSNKLFCFINSMSSNNDSANPSVYIYAEIDFWTNYIDAIMSDTPAQFEEYAHEYAETYNSKVDDRMPTEFVQSHTYKHIFEDVILFIKVGVDRAFFDASISATQGRFDPAGGVIDYVYVPFMTITKNAGGQYVYDLITGYKYINDQGQVDYMDFYDNIKQYGYFGFYDYENIYDAKLTPITPFGIFKASDWTLLRNGHRLFYSNEQIIFVDGGNNYNLPFSYTKHGETYKHYIYRPSGFGNRFSQGCIYKTDQPKLLSTLNEEEAIIISSSVLLEPNINASYDPMTERKLYQYPYYKKTLSFNNNDYNITPEPNGTSTSPFVTIKVKALNEMAVKISNIDSISNVFILSLVNDTGIPTSVDAYKAYASKQLEADMWRLAVAELSALASTGVGIATGNQMLAVGGIAASVNAGVKYASNIEQLSKTPDKINNPSNNSFDNIYTACPIIRTSELKDEDIEAVTTIWRRFGYPIKEFRQFTSYRFWYDYKQLKMCSLPSITNTLARKTIENALNEGLTIWHQNTVVGGSVNAKTPRVMQYNLNNPSNNNCKEEVI